ncbi:MAG: hypothetical protein HXY36_06510 [Chloroflexi bacterium]|nr:hypothetical protein [Chloroflexota bacterium]
MEALQGCHTHFSATNASLTPPFAHGRFDSTVRICDTTDAPGNQSSGDRPLKWQPSKSPEKELGYRKAAKTIE